MTLTADGLDLGQLFALTRLDGLSGEGEVHGALPVRIQGGVAVIAGGASRPTGPASCAIDPLSRRPPCRPAAPT